VQSAVASGRTIFQRNSGLAVEDKIIRLITAMRKPAIGSK
jgi:hypothetical protein